MDILNWILSAVTCIFGGTSLYTLVLYRRQTKRFKDAEAFEKEVKALEAALNVMREQIDFCQTQIEILQKSVLHKDERISRLNSVIVAAHKCSHITNVTECPVLVKKSEYDALYYTINKKAEE